MLRSLRPLLKNLFFEENWALGLIPSTELLASIRNKAQLKTVEWLKGPSDCFVADPCWLDEGRGLISCEAYFYRDRRGQLAIAELTDGRCKLRTLLGVKGRHLSFPQIYHQPEGIFIVPESALDGVVRALAIDPTTFQVIAERLLLRGVQLVDPIIFESDSGWWMIANDFASPNTGICTFQAPNFFGPWTQAAHLSLENSRAAGKMFTVDGTQFWPTQYNTFSYGGGIILRVIESINPREVHAAEVTTLYPQKNASFCHGLHSISVGDQTSLVDGKTFIQRPFKVADVLISRARRRLRADLY